MVGIIIGLTVTAICLLISVFTFPVWVYGILYIVAVGGAAYAVFDYRKVMREQKATFIESQAKAER
jgi:uncharacterized BrkB/YihY/UPF0761 family membrane protein